MLDRNPNPARPDVSRPTAGAIAGALAQFVGDTPDDAIPAEIRERALHHILDAVGIAFAVSREGYAEKAVAGIEAVAGAGTVPVIGFDRAWGPRDAATINGLLCHGLDFDDTHLEGIIHPTVAQFPAALSAAVMAGVDTRAMVTAYILGVEAAVRIASVAKGGFHKAGFHPTGICNAPAAALTAGRLLGLDTDRLRHAQGIALSMASGTLEFLEDGAWTKRLHPGWAASSGIVAASMAKEGYVGATSPYSGRFGLFRAFLGTDEDCDYDRATAGLGHDWELQRTAIKPYPACHLTHGCIDAAIAIAKSRPLRVGDIESVTALVAAGTIPTICEPLENKRRPKNAYDAQFSIPFLVASALLTSRLGLAEIAEDCLADPEILTLAALVDYEADPNSGYPRHYSGEVVVRLKDGTQLSQRCQINSGAPEMPVSNADIVRKFEGNAAVALGAAHVDRIKDLILQADLSIRPALDWATELGSLHGR
jgi:2-methylcitrate dehydratase PrpD